MKQNSCEACFSVNFKNTYAISMGVNKRLLKRLNWKWVWLFLNKANCFGKKVFLQESVTYPSHGYLSTSFEEVNIDLWFPVAEKKKKTFEVRASNFRFYFFLRTSDFTFFQGIFFRLFFFLQLCSEQMIMFQKRLLLVSFHLMFFVKHWKFEKMGSELWGRKMAHFAPKFGVHNYIDTNSNQSILISPTQIEMRWISPTQTIPLLLE